jgi:hypothetical protein
MRKATQETEEGRQQKAAWGRCYCGGAGPRITALTSGMFRGPAFDHFRTAGVEVLMGLRAILDQQIDRLSRRREKGTKVPVE